jgi:hypothetical protein
MPLQFPREFHTTIGSIKIFFAGVAGMLTVVAEAAAVLVRMSHTLVHRLRCFPWEAGGDRMLRLL